MILLSYLLFSYYALGRWWNSAAGFLLILFFSGMLWGGDCLKRIGLNISPQGILLSILVTLLVIFLSYLLIGEIAADNGITLRAGNWRDYFHEVFYILNEEIVLGALILFWVAGKQKTDPVLSCVILALLFSVVHFVFYRWVFDERGLIGPLTLTTLFLVGFFRNSLILISGHIGYSWAFHFGWISVMFGAIHINNSGVPLAEFTRFNLYLGSVEMLVVSAFFAVGALIVLKFRPVYI